MSRALAKSSPSPRRTSTSAGSPQCNNNEKGIAMNEYTYEAEEKRTRNDTVGCTLLAVLLVGVFSGALLF